MQQLSHGSPNSRLLLDSVEHSTGQQHVVNLGILCIFNMKPCTTVQYPATFHYQMSVPMSASHKQVIPLLCVHLSCDLPGCVFLYSGAYYAFSVFQIIPKLELLPVCVTSSLYRKLGTRIKFRIVYTNKKSTNLSVVLYIICLSCKFYL